MLYFYNSVNLFDKLGYKNFIFLAGPSNRNGFDLWREEFVNKLNSITTNYDLFLPKYWDINVKLNNCDELNSSIKFDQEEIYQIERRLLKIAWMTVFWFDRTESPGLTSNIEFGNFAFRNNTICICGGPEDSKNNGYLKYVWENEQGRIWHTSLDSLVKNVSSYLSN